MKHQTLHELAKFGSGLVVGDFIAMWWLWTNSHFPIKWLGIVWSSDLVVPSLIFDIGLILILVHYGWNVGKVPALKERMLITAGGFLFAAIAIVHVVQIFMNIDLSIGSWDMPVWLSWTSLLATTYLSYMSFRLAAKMKS